MGYIGNYGGTFGESALTPASNHAEATLVVKILRIREIAVLGHGCFEVRLTAAKDRTVKTVRLNQGTATETVPIPRRPLL